jgi:hypothetical protein
LAQRTRQSLRVNGSGLLHLGAGAENAHKLALRSQKSYPAIRGYIDDSDGRARIDLDVVTAILVDGLGFTYDQLLDLKIGEVFKLVEVEDV